MSKISCPGGCDRWLDDYLKSAHLIPTNFRLAVILKFQSIGQ
jgi:hypothetical protein